MEEEQDIEEFVRVLLEANTLSGEEYALLYCWRPYYFNILTQTHQKICTARLLREFKYPGQLYHYIDDVWTKDFTDLLTDALQLKREFAPVDYLKPIENGNDWNSDRMNYCNSHSIPNIKS
jgi:hypothetical protein